MDLSDLQAYRESDDLFDFLTASNDGSDVTIDTYVNGDSSAATDITLTLEGIGSQSLEDLTPYSIV